MLRSTEMFPRFRRSWLLGAALFAAGCLSPTLPLPPPSDPMVSMTSTEGLVLLTGTVQPDSEVFALNHRTNLINGQYTSSGNYSFTMPASERDGVSIWYVHGTVESDSNDFVVRLRASP